MRGSCRGSGRHGGPGAGGSCGRGRAMACSPPAPALGPAAARGCPRGRDARIQADTAAAARARRPLHLPAGPSAVPSARPAARALRGTPGTQSCSPGEVQHSLHHVGAVLGAGLAEQAVVGLGGRAGESGGGPGPPRPRPELWLLTMASFCPWAVLTPAASGRPGRRSVLFPTSMSGSAVSAACWSEGQLMARARSLAGAASVGLCPFCSRCSPRPGWSQALLHKRPSRSRFGAAPTAPCGAQHSLPQGCCPAPWGLPDPPLYLDVLNPLADADEAALGADVVEEQHAVGLAEVGLGNAPVPAARAVTARGARPLPTPGQLWGPASPAGWVPEAGMAPAGSAHLSCPAVSQICSVVCSPSTSSCFIWKSTPARRSSQARLPVPLPLHLSPGT